MSGHTFLDTFALLALVNRSDQFHAAVSLVYADLTRARARLLTSEWVFVEFLNAIAGTNLRAAALGTVDRLQRSARITIIPATEMQFDKVAVFYGAHGDKQWSFVDCASILICRQHGVLDDLTHDHHFAQAGLRVLV